MNEAKQSKISRFKWLNDCNKNSQKIENKNNSYTTKENH